MFRTQDVSGMLLRRTKKYYKKYYILEIKENSNNDVICTSNQRLHSVVLISCIDWATTKFLKELKIEFRVGLLLATTCTK